MNIWNQFKDKIKNTIIDEKEDIHAINYWRSQLFLTVVTYLIPIGTIISILGILMTLNMHMYLMLFPNFLMLVFITGIGFLKGIKQKTRRIAIIGVMYLIASNLLFNLGNYGPGALWLIFISILASLIIASKKIYMTVLFNAIVYISVAVLANTHVLHSKQFKNYPIQSWVSVGVSLVFISLIATIALRILVVSLELKIKSLTEVQKHLLESEEKLRIFFSSIGDGIIVADMNGELLQMNEVAQQLTGWSLEEAKGSTLDQVYVTQESGTENFMCNTVENLLMSYYLENYQNIKAISRLGNTYDVAQNVSPVTNKEGEILGIVIVFRDITYEKRKDEELLQAQKMEAIGRLAGGVAHDFNNMLTGIMGFTELIEIKVQGQVKLENYCKEILKTAERAADLTNQLLTFSHKRKNDKKPLSLNAAVLDALTLLGRTLDPKLQIVLDPTKKDTFITADISQIQNMIINLSINARDAMVNGGKLKIETKVKQLHIKECMGSEFNLIPGKYVELKISDEGCGMSQETCARIFEPFYTTKVIGRGTGLGLATVYGMVVGHNGAISVKSEEGIGTTFILLFPNIEPVQVADEKENLPKEEMEYKKGFALIVDDEDHIRNMLIDMLQHLGYKTLIAENGIDGINLFQAYHWEISLVLLDVIMPKMGGKEVLKEMKRIDTEVPIIIVSGYIDDEQVSSFEALGSAAFMKKPFKMGELALVIENIS